MLGVAEDVEAWRPAEVADKAEVWTLEEATAKAGDGRPANSAGRLEVTTKADGSWPVPGQPAPSRLGPA